MKFHLDGSETERLIFRKIRESDFDDWLEFFKDPSTSIHWIEEKESPEKECTKWYEKQFGRYKNDRGGMNAVLEKLSGRLVGHCGLLVQVVDGIQELEIGYSLLPKFWGKGYASEAAKLCRDAAFQRQFSESLISIIGVTNLPSENVARKNGMTIAKATVNNGNQVNIFRVTRSKWTQLQEIEP
jgi:ribosomal-protein-alanine N-acetyltransferase